MQEPGISSKDKHHRHCEIKKVRIYIFDNIILHYYVQFDIYHMEHVYNNNKKES